MQDEQQSSAKYPATAYDQDGVLWWRRQYWPGKKVKWGGERKAASWLAYNLAEGSTFTMSDLRGAIGEPDKPNSDEQLGRRLRRLRPDGWVLTSYKHDDGLRPAEYRLDRIGWHPGTGEPRPRQDAPSAMTRRLVLERDSSTCAICGIRAKEIYDDAPDSMARMTVGHRIPGARATSKASVDELQAECARCNETVRDFLIDPITIKEVLPAVKDLKRSERSELLRWLEMGRRIPNRVDRAYATVSRLSRAEQSHLIWKLRKMAGQNEQIHTPDSLRI